MRTLIRKGRVICPATGLDLAQGTLVIEDGHVVAVENGVVDGGELDRVLDVPDTVVAPGLIDLHAHLCEPGEEHKEDLASGGAAAARGGFTAVALSSATEPCNDHRGLTEYLLRRGAALGGVRFYPVAAITRGRAGAALTEMFDLAEAGAVAFGDGGRAVPSPRLLRRALEYATAVGVPIFEHPEDAALAAGGVMHEGPVCTRLGLAGVPAAAEDVVVLRDIALVEQTGARLHLGPISTRGAVEAVRRAKAAGLPVTCAVTPAHLHLTDEAVAEAYSTDLRVRPPLRPKADVAALRAAVADGTVDAIASGHQPQSPVEKALELDLAAPGMIGLETALGLVLRLVDDGVLSLSRAIERLTTGPARVINRSGGTLAPGAPADVVIFDPAARVRVEAATLASRSANTPFLGQALPGRVAYTLVGGVIVYDAEHGGVAR